MTLDPREFGIAPRLQELTSSGALVYTLAGVMEAVGVKHRATLYNMLWVMALRRNVGSAEKPTWRWLRTDIEAALKNRPKVPKVGSKTIFARLAKFAKANPNKSFADDRRRAAKKEA